MTTQELETVKKELAEISAFVKEKVAPAHEERVRLREAVDGLVQAGREMRRKSLLAQAAGTSERPVVDLPGRYSGFDALDMAIMRSLNRAARMNGATPAVEAWDTHIKAAMDSLTPGAGAELVPQAEAQQLWADVNSQTMVASQFSRISMPTNPFDIPLQLGDVNWYPAGQNTAARTTAPATAKRAMTAYELIAHVPWSLSLEEDAVIAMMPELRKTVVRNAAEVVDDVLLNADTTAQDNINADGTQIDIQSEGLAQYLVGFDGLVHLPLMENTNQRINLNGAVTAAAYNQLLKKLGKYGVRPNEAVFITDINTYLASLALDEVETVDKLGRFATVLTGQLGVIYGHPIIVSGQMKLADTDGKVTDGGNVTNTGRILAVNTSQWRVGYRRELTIETERDIQKQQNVMVVTMRLAFADRSADRSTATHTALQYNITGVA